MALEATLEPVVRAAASARTPGYDVARAIAIFGMVLVNFQSAMDGAEPGAGPEWLIWLSDRVEGRAAVLFVVLAGVGIALRTRRARARQELAPERIALLKRSAILLAVGVVHLHMWEWDILHLYGFYLAVGALFIGARRHTLLAAAALSFVAGGVLLTMFDYEMEIEIWSASGFVLDTLFTGDHPLFPWLAFIFVGMWLGRHDLRDPPTRHRMMAIGLATASAGELCDTVVRRAPDVVAHDPDVLRLMFGWPRPPSPAFVLAAGGTAIVLICLAIALTEPRPTNKVVVALTATGQLAFTLYLAHTITIVLLEEHGLLAESSTVASVLVSAIFSAAATAGALWWRRRWRHGPLEALIRQTTDRVDPAPWGGATLR